MPARARAGRALDALGDDTRRAVFEHLVERPRTVGELATLVPVTRPAVSQHLKVLKLSGLVSDRAVGTRRIYRVEPAGVAAMREYLDQMWAAALASFAQTVEEQERTNEKGQSE